MAVPTLAPGQPRRGPAPSLKQAPSPRRGGALHARLAARTGPPGSPGDHIERPRLREMLDAAVPHGVALLLGPAGFGKTVALADFAREASFPCAWLTLTPVDADLAAFTAALGAALRRVVPRLGRRAEAYARGGGDRAVELVADELADELARYGGPIGIVLDDFHAADAAREVGRMVGALLQQAPPNLFVAIASRTMPGLPHARLAAAERLVAFSHEDLRFTEAEVARYLGVEQENERAVRLHDRTDGWPAALRFAQGTSSHDVLERYLETEVLQQQPEPVQEFLARASVPPSLTADLCTRVLGEPRGAAFLQEAHAQGLFVVPLDDGGWRIHDLFRDFLRARLYRSDPALWTELHRRVADEMRAAGQPADAVDLLIGAGLYEPAAEALLAGSDKLASEGRWSALRRWFKELPASVVRRRPRLLTLHGRAILLQTEPTAALALYDAAIEGCQEQGDAIGTAEALAYRATRLRISGRIDQAAEDCQRALGLLGNRDARIRATVLRNSGIVAAWFRDYASARESLERALDAAQRHRDRAEMAMCERSLGWVYSYQGDAVQASSHYERAVQLWEQLGDLSALGEVRISLGHTYRELGATELARQALDEAVSLAERTGDRRALGYASENLAILEREAGQIDAAINRFQVALDVARQIDDGQLLVLCLDGLAQCHRIGGLGPQTAEVLARQALHEAERSQNTRSEIGATITLASALLAQGQGRVGEAREVALRALERVDRAQPSPDLVRASLLAAVADRTTGGSAWKHHLGTARLAVESLSARGFLRAEVTAVGPSLGEMGQGDATAILASAPPAVGPTPPDGAASTSLLPRIDAKLLGRPEVLVDGRPPFDVGRSWSRQPTRALFFLLEAHRAGLSADAIVSRLWPGEEPGKARRLLWAFVNRVRSVLGSSGLRGKDIVLYDRELYRLNPDLRIVTDVAAFEAAVGQALSAARGSQEEEAALRAADVAYSGDYLEGLDDTWVIPRRQRLLQAHARVLRRLTECALDDERSVEAIDLGEKALRADPISEEACSLLLRALIASGDHARARYHYRRFARRLESLVGVHPSPALERLLA